MLRLSSIPNEYYLGDLPGTIQYNKELQDIISLDCDKEGDHCGYHLCDHSIDNLRRTIPYTQRNKEWKIILMMKKEESNGEIWMKSALLNKKTGKIALLTTTNNRINLEKDHHRPVKTIDGKWFVGHYRMSAPIYFWKELKNRLLY